MNNSSNSAAKLEAVGSAMRTPNLTKAPLSAASKSKKNNNNSMNSSTNNIFKSTDSDNYQTTSAHNKNGTSANELSIIGSKFKGILTKEPTIEELIQEHKDFEAKHVVKKITYSGGFKMPEETLIREQQRREEREKSHTANQKRKSQEKFYDSSVNKAGVSKTEILQQLGIESSKDGEQFDRLQDRVYETRLEDAQADKIEDQVFDKIDHIHQRRQQLQDKLREIEQAKESKIQYDKERLQRLTGEVKFKPKYLSQSEIEEEEFEESKNLQQEVEEYYIKKYNLEPSDKQKREMEEQEESKKSFKERFFENKNRFGKDQKDKINNVDDQIQTFFQTLNGLEKPTLEETEKALELHSSKIKLLERQWRIANGLEVSDEEKETANETPSSKEYLSYSANKQSPLNVASTVSHRAPIKRSDDHPQRVSFRENQNNYENDPINNRSPYNSFSDQIKNKPNSATKGNNNSNNPYRLTQKQQMQQQQEDQEEEARRRKKAQMVVDPEVKEYQKFENEFKDFVRERKKREQISNLSRSMEKKDFEKYESTSPNPKRWGKQPNAVLKKQEPLSIKNNSKLSASGAGMTQEEQKRIDDLKMIQTLFDQIDTQKSGLIDKLDSIKHIVKQKSIMQIYDLTPQSLNRHVNAFVTAKKGYFTFEEFVKFLQSPRDVFEKRQLTGNYFVEEIKRQKDKAKLLKKHSEADQQNDPEEGVLLSEANSTCLLQGEHQRIMREIYNDLDKHGDMIVSRKQLIDKLRSDVRIVKILHLPAVYMPSIEKTMKVDKVLLRIEQEEFLGDPQAKAAKEYITWAQFIDYFNDMKSLKKGNETATKDKMQHIKVYTSIKDNVDDQNEVDMDEATRTILETEYEALPKQQETYVITINFIENVKMNPRYTQCCNNVARRKSNKYDLNEELLCEVLDRMELETDEFIDFEEILEYFTRRGRPKYAEKKEEDQEFQQKYSTIPRQRDNEELFKNRKESQLYESGNQSKSGLLAEELIDGYDSDPETHIYQKGVAPERKNLTRPKSAMTRSGLRNSSRNHSNVGDDSHEGDMHDSLARSLLVAERRPTNDTGGEQEEDNDEYYGDDDNGDENNQQQQHVRVGRFTDRSSQEKNRNNQEKVNSKPYEMGDYKEAMLDYYDARAPSKGKKFPLTKPEPYEFDKREKENKKTKTIRQRKVEEMIEEAKLKEEKECAIRSKPKEVPSHVKKPLFQKIMNEQRRRREEVKENFAVISIQNEKPFKFFLRDKDPNTSLTNKPKKKTYQEREEFVFHASKVPWFCSTNLLEKINRDEDLRRQERVAKQAQKTMSMSKLPPRMEKHEQEKKAREMMENYTKSFSKMQTTTNPIKLEMFPEPTFQPPKAKPIPNFMKMHSEFQDKLDKQRKGKRPTEVQPFAFQEARKLPPRDYLDQENALMKATKVKPAVDKLKEAQKWRNHKPKYQPPTIEKLEQNIERIKKIKDDKEKAAKEADAKEKAKLKEREEMGKIVREKYSKNDQTVRLKENTRKAVEQKKKEFKEKEEQYQKDRAAMLEKVKQRPLLMEQKCGGRAYLEKLKTLDKIDMRLKDRGMNSKERQKMYTKEEIKMLQEIKALKARGFKSFRNELDVGGDVSLSPPRSDSEYDYEELEKEYGDDPLNIEKKKDKNAAAKIDPSKESFLNSSQQIKTNSNYEALHDLMNTDSNDEVLPKRKSSKNREEIPKDKKGIRIKQSESIMNSGEEESIVESKVDEKKTRLAEMRKQSNESTKSKEKNQENLSKLNQPPASKEVDSAKKKEQLQKLVNSGSKKKKEEEDEEDVEKMYGADDDFS